MDFEGIDLEELKDTLGEEVAKAVKNDFVEEEDWTDEELAAIASRPSIALESTDFTSLSKNRDLMRGMSEAEVQCVRRWVEIEALREHYSEFEDFLYDCMTELMGFQCTELQIDIGKFLQSDCKKGMVQAQRSQAKSTIIAMFAVWQLIHDCKHRVLIISAGADVAAEIANWVIQIIMNWDILECMRPDRQHGDRASSKAFDIHWQLKGAEKSPSVACIGITANMQGRRADLLIPDDIESSKNGNTDIQRAALEHLSKDFTSICQNGRIMYLGTPQTVDSIYNNLEARGYTIQIWTGRVPTDEEAKYYGSKLAPYIRRMMVNPENKKGGGLLGDRGVPTDPVLLGEEALIAKEQDQGASYFNLQHMLNTELSDEERHPLKPQNLIVSIFGNEKAHGKYGWLPIEANRINVDGKYTCRPRLYRPSEVSDELYDFEGKYMYVDTAGGGKNGDETVAVVSYFLHGYILIPAILRLAGGYEDAKFKELSNFALVHGVSQIDVEKNFGYGAFANSWRPIIQKTYREAGEVGCPSIEDVWETGQKELRIIDTLEPVMGRHKLIIHEDVIEYDNGSVKIYPVELQETYKLIHQLAKITRDKGSLKHDDRLDAFAGAVRFWTVKMAIDEDIRMEQKVQNDNMNFLNEWGANQGQNSALGLSSNRFQKITNKGR